MARLCITEPVHPDAIALLREAGLEPVLLPDLPEAAHEGELARAEIVLIRTRPMRVMGPALRHISKHGAGVDNIDLGAAARAGVVVTNTPGANAASVAEFALLGLLALARGLPAFLGGAAAHTTPGLEGRRLVVVGYGATGRRVAALGAAFGMEVIVHSPRLAGTRLPEGYRIAPDLDAALAEAWALSLHCPLTPATRGMIGAAALARLPRGAFLINTARGGLVDSDALAQALAAGQVAGALLDVTEPDPLPPDHPLRHDPRCILTPHAATLAEGAFRRMGLEAARNILDLRAGRLRPETRVLPKP
ncbi:MAG: NAD(P)-dependent oxidoreductase [Gemmobacter sp.]